MTSIIQSLTALLVPAVAIVGLVVLMALGKIDQAAGLSLIGVLSGIHGGAAVTANATRAAQKP